MEVIQHQAEMFILRLLRVEVLAALRAELAAAVLVEAVAAAAVVQEAEDSNNQSFILTTV